MMTMSAVHGLSVLVTGGGSGIGAATALRLAKGGANVTIAGRRRQPLQQVAESAGSVCRPVVADIANNQSRQALVQAAVEHGGGLDAVVHCAGNMLRGTITELDEDSVLELFRTNVVAAMMLTGLAAPHLAERRGSVVFVGSVHTRRAYPGASAYAATKGAIDVLTRVLAAEMGASGVRVNCVVPGAVPTDLNVRAGILTYQQQDERMRALAQDHALGRVGSADEVAHAIEHLIVAPWTTGAALAVDGGLSLGTSRL